MREPPGRMREIDRAQQIYGGLFQKYVDAMWRMDPLADEAVAANAAGRARVEAALRAGGRRQAPPSLARLLDAIESEPTWLDWDRVNHGAHTFQRCGLAAALTLSAHSLMGGYQSAAASKPLALTGQLELRAPRRLAETGRFVTEVVQRDGLRPGRPGLALCVRVRLMHAQVRRMLLESGRWDEPAWGAPINQADMTFTGLEFSSMMLRGARALGHTFTADEADAMMHLWRYVSHLLGVDEPMTEELRTEARANRYEALARMTFDGPDEDSVALATALRRAIREAARTPRERIEAALLTPIHNGLAWKLNGPELSRALRTPHRRARHLVDGLAIAFAPFDRLRRSSRALDAWMARVGNRDFRRRIASGLGGVEPDYQSAPSVQPRFTRG